MVQLFNAKLELINAQVVSADEYKITAKIVDNTGNFLAKDALVGDLIYIDYSITNSLFRYKIVNIDAASTGSTLVANVKWDIKDEEAQEPTAGGDGVIGRRNEKGDTINLTSITTNQVGEALQTAVRNFEQALIIDQVSEKESGLENPDEDGKVLASTVDGVRSWVKLPSFEEAINAIKDQPNGIPSLDESGKIPAAQIPSIAITNIFPVASEEEMLKLGEQGAEKGDLATRTDDGTQYILIDNDPSDINNWKCLEKPCEIHSVNGKVGVVVLTTTDVAEDTNLYFTDERVEKSPAVVALKEALEAVPTDALLKSEYDKDDDGIIDVAKLAESVQYANILGKPEFAAVAVSGSYNDLIDKPEIPVLPEFAKVAISGQYEDLLGKPELKDIATSGSYNDLADKPELKAIATSGSYNDLTDKPAIPSKVSELTLDNVYTKVETDKKVADLINDTEKAKTTTYSSDKIDELVSVAASTGGSSVMRYESNGCMVLASGEGVTVTKVGNKATVVCPAGVTIMSLSVHFLTTDLNNATNCLVDFGTSTDYSGTGKNTDYSNMLPPIAQVINDVEGSIAVRQACAFNYNTNSHTIQVTGLLTGIGCWVRLTF